MIMPEKMAKLFIITSLFFLLFCCIERRMFPFVIADGVLILISILLFSLNMLLTLLLKAENKNFARALNKPIHKRLATATAILAAGMFLFNTAPCMASATQVPEKADVIIIGDRLVDIAYNLGVLPAAMSVRCSLWPLCDTLKTSCQVLGCPNCLQKKKAKPLISFAKAHQIKTVIIEKGDPFCARVPELHPEKIAGMLENQGLSVTVVEYSHDLTKTVNQMAAILGKADKAQTLLNNYEKNLAKVMKNIEKKSFAKRVVILNGVFQSSSGKSFLRVESPGGYADQFLLAALKSTNVGNEMVKSGKKPSKGHYAIRKLDSLVAAEPDAIIVTGKGFAVQKALARALVQNPNLARVPAIKNQAVYNLPGFIQSSLIEYPSILSQWAFVLAR